MGFSLILLLDGAANKLRLHKADGLDGGDGGIRVWVIFLLVISFNSLLLVFVRELTMF
jgi:hypothetical protein